VYFLRGERRSILRLRSSSKKREEGGEKTLGEKGGGDGREVAVHFEKKGEKKKLVRLGHSSAIQGGHPLY